MKYLSIIRYAFLIIGVLTVASLAFMDQDPAVALMLIWGAILLALTAAVTVLLPLVNIIKDPKGAGSTMVGVLIVAVVLICGYLLGSDVPVARPDGTFFSNPVELKLSDMGIYATYAAMVATIVLIFYGEVRNSFK